MRAVAVSLSAAGLIAAAAGAVVTARWSAAGAQEATAPRSAAADTVPLVGVWGAKSAIKERSYARVTNAEDWTALWLRHVGADAAKHSPYYNAEGVPDVDFTRCMVVAICQGERWNSAGVRVVSVSEDDERVLVRFDDRSYQTAGEGPDGGRVAATAFGLFVLPRSAKAVVLEEDVQNLIGQPPRWKERARFDALAK